MIFLIVVTNGYVLVILVGAEREGGGREGMEGEGRGGREGGREGERERSRNTQIKL